MSHSSINQVAMPKVNVPSSLNLQTRLSKVVNILKGNGFPELSFFVHYEIDEKPTVVLVGKYESSQDLDLFTLLDSKEVKRILPESMVVEWMHGDRDFPTQTILETYPYNP